MAIGAVNILTVQGNSVWFEVERAPTANVWTLTIDGLIQDAPNLSVPWREPIPDPFVHEIEDLAHGQHQIDVGQFLSDAGEITEVARGLDTVVVGVPFEAIRPTVQMVADLLRTRTISEGGKSEDIFNELTYPTADQADRLIDQATNAVFTQLPGSVAEPWAPAGQHLAALYAAILIEASYFREQLTDDQIQLYRDLLISGIRGLGAAIGEGETGAGSRMAVDSVVMRGVATVPPEYLWMLDMPPADIGAGTQLTTIQTP